MWECYLCAMQPTPFSALFVASIFRADLLDTKVVKGAQTQNLQMHRRMLCHLSHPRKLEDVKNGSFKKNFWSKKLLEKVTKRRWRTWSCEWGTRRPSLAWSVLNECGNIFLALKGSMLEVMEKSLLCLFFSNLFKSVHSCSLVTSSMVSIEWVVKKRKRVQ